jgi:hypothetical protein
MEPHLSKNDKNMFYKYLDNATVYFEYGSGGSTYQASIRNNILKIYSVESDKEWYNKLKKVINIAKVNYIYNEMDTKPNTWGNPGPKSTHTQRINYSNYMRLLNEAEKNQIDLVFIDGRFRVACCLKAFADINNNTLIAFDDFLNRPYYHIVLNFYDIVDKTNDKRMVILKKKTHINTIPKELIQKYELIED